MKKLFFAKEIEQLEKYYNNSKDIAEYRIIETPRRYKIYVEILGEPMAYYSTSSYEIIKTFCASHSNGRMTINGLGCTEPELYNLTIEYIKSMGIKPIGYNENE